MPIKGLSENRRMPRIGKIHLGIKVKNKKGTEYPKATDYFVFPDKESAGGELLDQLIKEYGEKPKTLQILFPLEDSESIASQYYRCYSRSRGLICRGDGEVCMRLIDTKTGDLASSDTENTELKEMPCAGRDCPEYQRESCREVMNLQFMLPKISGLGVWQIDTSSINSIRNINSCLEMIKAVYGRVSMVPLSLSMEKIEVTPPNQKKKTVSVLNIRSMDNVIQALINAKKPPLTLLTGKSEEEIIAEAERDIAAYWPQDEQERALSPEEAASRMKPSKIEQAQKEDEEPQSAENEATESKSSPPKEKEDSLAPTPPEPEPEQKAADPDECLHCDAGWLMESMALIHWQSGTAISWIKSQPELKEVDTEGKKLIEILNSMHPDQARIFIEHITSMREVAEG